MPSAVIERIGGLTNGDIGGLLEAIDHRLGEVLEPGKARRYGEIRAKLSDELSARALDRVTELEPGEAAR